MISGISLVKLFRDAVQYAEEFDKALTDIAVITNQPIENVREMGTEYRRLANQLNTSSTSIAKSAATIYRQGYTSEAEVEAIISGATKFGAVTDLTTDEAIGVMTASLQNFKREGEDVTTLVGRITDTWSYMGDTVATNGVEISKAMSKASASVKGVGIEFETASAMAAIMLARTQQGGEVVGTQLNSIASRYMKVTSSGYKKITSDDEGEALNFNDVSKSLKKAGIEMYDMSTKTFRPFGEVLKELSQNWGTLDEATQKYIATSIAGTRGMNYFLTLMENYDDVLELESQAQQNTGIVDEKYSRWLEGTEAAHENLKNSFEDLFSVLSGKALTDTYNGLADIVDTIKSLVDATDGAIVTIPLFVVALSGILSIVSKINPYMALLVLAVTAIGMAYKGVKKLIDGDNTVETSETLTKN